MAKLDKTSDQFQDQLTAALTAEACDLIYDQVTSLGSYTTPRDAIIFGSFW